MFVAYHFSYYDPYDGPYNFHLFATREDAQEFILSEVEEERYEEFCWALTEDEVFEKFCRAQNSDDEYAIMDFIDGLDLPTGEYWCIKEIDYVDIGVKMAMKED